MHWLGCLAGCSIDIADKDSYKAATYRTEQQESIGAFAMQMHTQPKEKVTTT